LLPLMSRVSTGQLAERVASQAKKRLLPVVTTSPEVPLL
jgi:hypothetical protein